MILSLSSLSLLSTLPFLSLSTLHIFLKSRIKSETLSRIFLQFQWIHSPHTASCRQTSQIILFPSRASYIPLLGPKETNSCSNYRIFLQQCKWGNFELNQNKGICYKKFKKGKWTTPPPWLEAKTVRASVVRH